MADNKEYSVNWKAHMSYCKKAFHHLWSSSEFVDVTLYCEGKKIHAHKMLLSACSSYFHDIFKDVPCQHATIILNGVEYQVLNNILQFIYNGEVSVDTNKLDAFLKTAQLLKISGLTEINTNAERIEEATLSNDRQETVTTQETNQYSEPASSAPEEPPLKKAKSKDNNQVHEKVKTENENITLADIKCEPTEVVVFEEPLEDPLQPETNRSSQDYAASFTPNYNEEEIKLEVEQVENSYFIEKIETDVKTKPSNFADECLRCQICNKVFSHPYSLHHHKAVHSGNTQCPICNAVLSRKYNLKMHMKARHNLEYV